MESRAFIAAIVKVSSRLFQPSVDAAIVAHVCSRPTFGSKSLLGLPSPNILPKFASPPLLPDLLTPNLFSITSRPKN
jgi:hypothetical protein